MVLASAYKSVAGSQELAACGSGSGFDCLWISCCCFWSWRCVAAAACQVFSTDKHPNSLGPCPDDPLDAGKEGQAHMLCLATLLSQRLGACCTRTSRAHYRNLPCSVGLLAVALHGDIGSVLVLCLSSARPKP